MIPVKYIERNASRSPDSLAVIPFDRPPVSYRNLRNILWGNIRQLTALEIQNQTRIGFISTDAYEMVQWIYSVSSLCIAVPIDANLSETQYSTLFELMKLDFIILGKDLDETIQSIVEAARIPIIRIKEEPIPAFDHPSNSDDDICLLLTTSGTTSKPKLVPITSRNLFVSNHDRSVFFELTHKDCALIPTPLSRGIAINVMLSTHIAGGSIALMSGFNHADFFKLLEKHPISWFNASPAVMASIVSYANEKRLHISSPAIRFIRSGGAPLSNNLKRKLEKLFSVQVVKSYGITEVGTICSTYNQNIEGKSGSVGISVGSEIKIHNGEVLVKGENVFPGYLDAPEIKQDTFLDGWFRTGDLGRIDEDGFVYIVGRIKEMINRGGEKISPYEVEEYLERNPSIKQAVVFPRIDNQGNEEVAAAIVLKDKRDIDALGLRNFLGAYISSYKIPSIYYVTDSIPVGENGKFQRRKLSAHFAGFTPLTDAGLKPSEETTPTERIVKSIYEKILNKKNISIYHNFFDLGGDSLSASLLHSELSDAFKIDIPVHALFDCPEISKISEFIDSLERKRGNLKFVVPLRKSGFKEPLFFVHSLDGDALGYYHVGSLLDPNRPVYGIQFKYDDKWTAPLDFSQIARRYIEEIKLVQPSGPYYIAGICLGGRIAYEIVQQLSDNHEDVEFLAMFDVILLSKNDAAGIPKNTIMKKSIRTLRQLMEIKPTDYGKLLSRKANSLYLYLSTKYIVKINSKFKRDFLLKNRRALLTQAGSISRHKTYNGPVIYYQAADPTPKSELSANAWKKLIPNIKVIQVDMEHNDFNDPLMAPKMAALLDKELRNGNE